MTNDRVADYGDQNQAEIRTNPAIGRATRCHRQEQIRRDSSNTRKDDPGAEILKLCARQAARNAPFEGEHDDCRHPCNEKVDKENCVERSCLSGEAGRRQSGVVNHKWCRE